MQPIRALAAWLFLGAASFAAAQSGSLAGYTRHVWNASDGLPEQTVQAFAQTPDGYLWIGTTGGLVRFDGAHFAVFDRQNTPALHENSIFCLMVSRDGTLWIGTEGGGLARYAHSQFRSWTTREGLSNEFIRTIVEDTAGNIWAGTDNGLSRLQGDRFVRVDDTATIPQLSVHSIYQDRSGRLWVGGFNLVCLEGMVAKPYSLGPESSQKQVKSILQTRDGTIWVGTVYGLNRMLPGHDSFEPVKGIRGTVRVLRQTQDGVLWIGTIGQGVFQYNHGSLTQITAPSQLPSNTVLNFFEDGEANFWIGTQTGMIRLTRSPVSVVSLPQANDSDFGTIYQDRDGSFWIGSTLLFRMKNGDVTPQTLPGMRGLHVRNIFRDHSGALWAGTDGNGVFRILRDRTTRLASGLTNNFIRAIVQDKDGSMWIGTDGGLNHILGDPAKQHIIRYEQAPQGLAYSSTRAILQDRRGDVWVGTDRGVSHLRAGIFMNDTATTALAPFKVWTIHEDAEGTLWFGTRDNGLFRFRDGKMTHFSTEDGLADNAIYQILEDNAGHFWMSGPNGISMLNRNELDAQAESTPRHLALTFYSMSELAANTEIYGGTQSSGCITAAGDVWFPSNLGPIHILPLEHPPPPPPPLHVENVLANGRPVPMSGPIILRPGISRLEFDFTPVRLGSQDGLRFRYLLEGFEKNWSVATAARTAEYTNLPAGSYRFRVQTFEVSNPDAASEVNIAVIQQPFFYRTWWFIAACVALFALLIYGIYQNRVRHVRARFEAVLEERSRVAREMHDTVIQGCTGVSALLEALSMEDQSGGADSGLMEVARLQVRTTIEEAREAIWNLRKTGDAESLGEKLETMTQQASIEFQVPVAWSIDGTPFTVSDPVVHDLLMVAREAVYNSMLHGHPAHVGVALNYKSRELILGLDDDGCGFDPQQLDAQNGHHFGLKGMRERIERSGGKFRLNTAPGKGVHIEVHLPRHR